MAKGKSGTAKKSKSNYTQPPMLFQARNYRLLIIGVLMVLVGFMAMYWENAVEGFVSLYISPLLILAGYGIVLASILSVNSDTSGSSQTTATG